MLPSWVGGCWEGHCVRPGAAEQGAELSPQHQCLLDCITPLCALRESMVLLATDCMTGFEDGAPCSDQNIHVTVHSGCIQKDCMLLESSGLVMILGHVSFRMRQCVKHSRCAKGGALTFVSKPPSFLACCISLMKSFCISFSYSNITGP